MKRIKKAREKTKEKRIEEEEGQEFE